jgi:hypothetical protein
MRTRGKPVWPSPSAPFQCSGLPFTGPAYGAQRRSCVKSFTFSERSSTCVAGRTSVLQSRAFFKSDRASSRRCFALSAPRRLLARGAKEICAKGTPYLTAKLTPALGMSATTRPRRWTKAGKWLDDVRLQGDPEFVIDAVELGLVPLVPVPLAAQPLAPVDRILLAAVAGA